MTPEARFTKIENAIQALMEIQARHDIQIEKQNAGIRDLIVVSRTVLDAVGELREAQKHTNEAQKHTDEKLNALIDTVDRIIRRDNGHKP